MLKYATGLTDTFFGCEKSRKCYGFVIYSYLKVSAFTAAKRANPGM